MDLENIVISKPKSDEKKGLLATIWEKITATDCGCEPGSSCCVPTAPQTEVARDEAATAPQEGDKSNGK